MNFAQVRLVLVKLPCHIWDILYMAAVIFSVHHRMVNVRLKDGVQQARPELNPS